MSATLVQTVMWFGMVAVALGGCAQAEHTGGHGSSSHQESVPEPKRVQTVDADLQGTGTLQKLYLTQAVQTDSEVPAGWDIYEDKDIRVSLENSEMDMHAEIKLEDLNHDSKPEVLMYRYSTGTAGAVKLNVYQTGSGGWTSLFGLNLNPMYTDEDKRSTVRYKGDDQVSFEDKETGLAAVIPLKEQEAASMKDLLPNIGTWIDPVYDYKLEDLDGDKTKEIITRQAVIGVSHPHRLALLETTYKWEKEAYEPKKLALVMEDGKVLAEVALGKKRQSRIVEKK